MRRRLILLVMLFAILAASAGGATPPFRARRPLRVALYPFVPQMTGLFTRVEQSFENTYPEIDVQIIDLSDNYYDETSPHAITNTDADVYELDSVFIDDFVANGRIQPLAQDLLAPRTFLPVAEAAVVANGSTYAVPHWVCTNFLFATRGDKIANAQSVLEIQQAIGESHSINQGLLIDMKGRSTLGELYLDALLDRDKTFAKASMHLTVATFDSGVADMLKSVRSLCDGDMCRDSDYHKMEGFYARRFAHHGGRAMTGYSERLYYVGEENLTACSKKECVTLGEMVARPLPLSESGSQPFAWVDAFAVSASCTNQCLTDAETFIQHTTSFPEVRALLLPSHGHAPRYLLPALAALYADKQLLAAAPIYADLQSAVLQAIPVRGILLNTNLRAIGKKLDDALPK
jgi:thiamine pyridinylase